MENRLIKLHRVTKVVKGGRIFSYTATSISGNKNGKIGFGRGKSKEILESIKKSYLKSNNNIITIKNFNNIIPFILKAKHNSTKIILIPTNKNIGIVSNKYVKQVLLITGITGIFSKIHGSTNPINVVICTIKALSLIRIHV
ncbi:30S ribosomal protein S5 [Candidatus Carsonella ruddii]|uniref:Small ribosomal subunit protein uS5 n=1 Tax=Candidatus Carsonella ruddii CE isolate Thao2000 TaxID=1202536 RepID=J7GSZ9_CARRU|nr:30S ribosomal protein S5 [Candidatus Carsonella ruddii]AFP83624.1 ribosomal protein S5 [Candidatus Carsonella ruddii CE isolate Thao2000]